MSSSTLPWLRRDTLEDEFDWKPGRPVNLLSPMLALNCLGRVCSSKSERGDALSGSGSAIETTESVNKCRVITREGQSECVG